jgi:methylthioribulose-1-phosphate dehydratase
MSKRTVRMNKKANADHQEILQRTRENSVNFTKLAADLAETGKRFYSRGWDWGTSGNFSAVTSWDPLRLAISSTGLDKGILTPAHFLEIDGTPNVIRDGGRPSTETSRDRPLRQRGRSFAYTLGLECLSCLYASLGGVILEGYEMLKGLTGVRTHEHREWLPILDNSQNTTSSRKKSGQSCASIRVFMGFFCGLYTWGANLQEAKRHIEILEFVMEVLVRSAQHMVLERVD